MESSHSFRSLSRRVLSARGPCACCSEQLGVVIFLARGGLLHDVQCVCEGENDISIKHDKRRLVWMLTDWGREKRERLGYLRILDYRPVGI